MKLNTKNQKCDTGLSVQSLIFDKKYFNASKSKDWAKSHGYKFNDIDVKDNTFRFRQDSPNKFDKDIFRTIAFRKGIKAVVACPIVNKFDNGGEADGIKPVYLEGYDFKDYEDMISSLKDAKSKKADISDYIDTPESYVKLLESYVKKMDDITEEYKYSSRRNGDVMVIRVKTYLKYNHEEVINKLVKSNNLTEEQAEILSNKFSDDNVNDDYELTNFILEQEAENASETLSDFIKLDLCKKDIGFVGSSGGYLKFQDLDFFDGVKERLEGEISDYFSSDAQFESNEYDFFEEYIQDKYGDIVEDLSNIDFLEYGFSVLEAYVKKLIKGLEKDALNGEIEYRGQEFIDESNANGWDSSVEDDEDNEDNEEEEEVDEYKDGGSVNTDTANNEDSPLPIGSIVYLEHRGGYSSRLTTSSYEIVGFLGTKEKDYNQKGVIKKIKLARYSAYPLKSNLKEVKGDMEEIAIPVEAEDLSLSRYRIYNKNPKGALISQSRIDSGKRRLAESEAVIEWEGVKPAYLMTKDEYNKEVTPKFREFNRFIGKNDKLFRKPNYQGIDYVDFETFKNTFVSSGRHDTAENSFNSYARRNEPVEQASPELIKKLNDYLSFFTPIFGKENISKIENDESGSNKRSVKRAFEDGTYEKLLRENKINYTLLQNIYNSVGLTIPSKLEKIEKEVVELGMTSDVKMQYEEKQKEFIVKLKDKFKDELQSYYEGYLRRYKNNFERLNDFYNKNGNNNFASLNEYKADYSRYNGVEPEKINERKYDRKLNEYIDVFTGKYKYHSDINVIEEYRTSNSDGRLIYDKDYYSNKNVLKLVDNWIDVLDEDAKNYANSLFEDLGKRILAEINSVNMLAKDIPDIKYGYIENLTDKGFEVWIDLEYTNGFILSIETNVIYAGGYNIQKLHTRGLFKFQNEGKFFSYDNIVEQYKKYNESIDKSKQVYYAKGIEENNQQAIKKIEKKREDSSNKRYKKSGGEHFLGFVDTHVEGRGDNYDENEEEIKINSDKLKIIESKKIALKSLISLESKSTNDLIKEKLALKIKEMEQEINDLESGKFAEGGGVDYELSDIEIKELLTDFTKYISKSEQGIENSINEYISRYNKGVFNETIDKNNLKETILISFYRFRYHDNFRQDLGVVTRFLNDYDKLKNGGNVGNVRSLLSKFEKEKPSIALFIISDTVAESFMRTEYDKNIVWENLTDEQKAKYNTDYRVSKHEFEKYLVYEFVKLYYSDEKIKNKCKGQSTTTIKHIKSVMNDIAKGYDVNNFPKVEEVKKPDLNIELVPDSELILMMKKQETIKQAIAEIKRRNEAKKNVTEETKSEPKETVSYYRSTPVGNVPSELVEQAISQVLLTPKYQNLTKEEADFLYKAFANYESQKGKSNDYIYVIEWNYKFGSNNIDAKEDDLNLKKFLQKMDKNGIIIFNYYDGTVEADKAVIDFINSVRGVINAIKNKMNVSSKEDVKDTSTTDLPEEIKEEIKMELPATQNTDINKYFKFYYEIFTQFKDIISKNNFIHNLKQFYPNLIENGDVKIVKSDDEYYTYVLLSDEKPTSEKFKIDSPYLEELLGKEKPLLSVSVYVKNNNGDVIKSDNKIIKYSVDLEENIANYIDSLYFISSVNKSDYSRYLLNKDKYFTTEQNFNQFEQSLHKSDKYDVTSTMYRVSDGSIVEVKKFVKETQVPNLYVDINNKNRIVTFSDEFGFEKVVKFKEIDKYIKEVLDSPDATDKIKLLKDFKGKLTQKVKDNVLKTMKLFAKATVYAKYMLNYNNGDFESTYTINPSKAEIKLRNEVLKVSTQEKNTQLPIKEEVVVEQTIIPTERKGIDIPTDSKAAIKDVLTLKKYWRLTESEAEYLYNKFKNYEELVNSDGEYVAKIDFLYNGSNYEEIKDLDNQIQEFIETLEDKGYVYSSIYDSEIEAYPITIDLVNSIRGRIDTRVNVSQGTDLFPATSKIEKANPNYEQIQKSKAVLRSLVYTVAKQKDAVMKKKLLDKMKEINEKIKELESQEFKKGGKVMEVLIGGKSDNLTVEDLAKKWKVRVSDIEKRISQGVKVESEHTSDKKLQMEIAKDHIFEMLDYYDRLESMEKQSRIKHTFITKKISDKQKKSIANYLKSKGISDAECDIHNNGNIFIYTELDSNVIKNISNYLKNNII